MYNFIVYIKVNFKQILKRNETLTMQLVKIIIYMYTETLFRVMLGLMISSFWKYEPYLWWYKASNNQYLNISYIESFRCNIYKTISQMIYSSTANECIRIKNFYSATDRSALSSMWWAIAKKLGYILSACFLFGSVKHIINILHHQWWYML